MDSWRIKLKKESWGIESEVLEGEDCRYDRKFEHVDCNERGRRVARGGGLGVCFVGQVERPLTE